MHDNSPNTSRCYPSNQSDFPPLQPLLSTAQPLHLPSLSATPLNRIHPPHPHHLHQQPLRKRKKMMQKLLFRPMNWMKMSPLRCHLSRSNCLPPTPPEPHFLHELRHRKSIQKYQRRLLQPRPKQQQSCPPLYWLLRRRQACPSPIFRPKRPKHPLGSLLPESLLLKALVLIHLKVYQ